MTKAQLIQKAVESIKGQTTTMLIEAFERTITDKDPNVPMVRGWLMDELEARNPEAFEDWINSLDDSPRGYYL